MKFFTKKVHAWPFVVAPIVVVVGAVAASVTGFFNPLAFASLFGGSGVNTHSSEVIKYVLPKQEVALASLHIEGLEKADKDGDLWGIRLPAADRKKYIEYKFNAKVGIDGSQVEIKSDDEGAYVVTIPRFIFIGHSDEQFEDPIESDGALSWLTEEISEPDMINKILSPEKKDEYVANSLQVLKDQSEAFYSGIIRSVDSDAELTFEFAQ